MKRFLMVLALVVVFVCFTACGSESDTVRLGSVGPLAGDVAIYGTSVQKGTELALKEINAAGGVQVGDTKKLIEYVGFLNDDASGDKAKTAFNTLYDKGMDFMIGAVTSGATEGLISEATKVGIPTITPTGTADGLTVGNNGDERDVRSNIFRVCFYDSYQAAPLADFSKEKGFNNVAVLYDSSEDYSTGLANGYEAKCKTYGMNVTLIGYQKGTVNFKSYFEGENGISNAKYDALFVPQYYQDVKVIVETARTNGFTNTILGADGWDGVLSVNGVKTDCLENCYFSNHFAIDSENEKVKSFVEAFRKEYNEDPNSFAVLGYDAVYVMKAAIEKAGTLDYAKVVAALSSADFEADCVTGKIKFDQNGNPADKQVAIITFEDGKMKFFDSYPKN